MDNSLLEKLADYLPPSSDISYKNRPVQAASQHSSEGQKNPYPNDIYIRLRML